MRSSARIASLLLFGFSLAVQPRAALAYDVDLTAETAAQAYQLRAADDTVINRRRLTQSLTLDIGGLGPTDFMGRPLQHDQFYLAVALRYDGELGDFTNMPNLSGRTAERDFMSSRLELLYAYVGGRNVLGVFNFKLGRQVVYDLLSFFSFDGLSVQLPTPFHIQLEAWGGLAVRGGSVIDSPVYRTDGATLSSNPLGSLEARQEDALAPTFGVAVSTLDLRDYSVRLAYQRTQTDTEERQTAEPGAGVVEERLALTARVRLFRRLILWGALRYDLLIATFADLQLGARLQLGHHALSAEYVHSAPTFDGDSIWNVFGAEAFDDVRVGYDAAHGPLSFYVRGFMRRFPDGDPLSGRGGNGTPPIPTPGLSTPYSYGGTVGVSYANAHGRGRARLDLYWEDGYGGRKAGVDGSGHLNLVGNTLHGVAAEGRVSFVDFRDDSRTVDHAQSLAVQGGVRWAVTPGLVLHGLIEENVNRLFHNQVRGLLLCDLAFRLGRQAHGLAPARAGLF